MESTEDLSRVPAHLRQFHDSSFLTPRTASSTVSWQSPTSKSPELCPPHWRRPPQRSLKSTLKAIVCKDWPTLLEPSPPQHMVPATRPQMRMKDSDDYITARAANPRTGMISPSVGTRTPRTPDSPGDALKLHVTHHVSPTPHPRTRPSLSRANEGRKISGSKADTKCTNINGVLWDAPHTATSPKAPERDVEHDHVRLPSPTLTEDSFVVHMPSAREPQPFAYPGYTAEQIEALEHYQRKTRRVSNEGYDRRLLQSSGEPATTLTAAECDNIATVENGPAVYTCPTGQHFVAYRYHHPHSQDPHAHHHEPPRITVRKRKTQIDKLRQEFDASPRVDAVAEAKKLFPSQSSPTKIVAIDGPQDIQPRYHNEILRTTPMAAEGTGGYPHTSYPSSSKHAQICLATGEISGKSIFGSAPSCTGVANAAAAAAAGDRHYADALTRTPSQPTGMTIPRVASSRGEVDLCSQLPRVRLVKPELAGVPQQFRGDATHRQCSFGCQREGSGQCAERRKASNTTVVHVECEDENTRHVSTSFVDHAPQQERAPSNSKTSRMPILLSTITSIFTDYAKGVHAQIPRWIAIVVDLWSPSSSSDARAKEKLEALKALASLMAHASAVCFVLAMVWKLTVAVLNLVEVVLWPLAVPLRIVRFMIGLG